MNKYKTVDKLTKKGYEYIVDKNGDKSWYLNGNRHREDGPAIEYKNGSKSWYLSGNKHREEGPAIEWADGDKSWYLSGRNYGKKEPDNWIELVSKNKQVKKEYKLKPLSKMV